MKYLLMLLLIIGCAKKPVKISKPMGNVSKDIMFVRNDLPITLHVSDFLVKEYGLDIFKKVAGRWGKCIKEVKTTSGTYDFYDNIIGVYKSSDLKTGDVSHAAVAMFDKVNGKLYSDILINYNNGKPFIEQIEKYMVHELGHILGLEHVDEIGIDTVMRTDQQFNGLVPSERDLKLAGCL